MIYIIDDDKSVRRSFEILFAAAGFTCKSFEGTKEFLDEYVQTEGDLLILDIHIPDINGCGLLKILKEKNIHISVIIVTAYDEEESRKCAEDYGVIDFLVKPVDGDALIELISSNTKQPTS
ncbi:MAG: response regulator [Ignavibacteriaceae bacterium]|nr:response regulator [Ignavibacteriaceae bacterium]